MQTLRICQTIGWQIVFHCLRDTNHWLANRGICTIKHIFSVFFETHQKESTPCCVFQYLLPFRRWCLQNFTPFWAWEWSPCFDAKHLREFNTNFKDYEKIFLGYYKFCLVKCRYFQLFWSLVSHKIGVLRHSCTLCVLRTSFVAKIQCFVVFIIRKY